MDLPIPPLAQLAGRADCLLTVWRVPCTMRICVQTAVKFWAYETLKTYVCADLNNPSLAERFTAGALAGAVSQLCIYPLEISKARIALSKKGEYKGIADCLRKTVHFEGWRAL